MAVILQGIQRCYVGRALIADWTSWLGLASTLMKTTKSTFIIFTNDTSSCHILNIINIFNVDKVDEGMKENLHYSKVEEGTYIFL